MVKISIVSYLNTLPFQYGIKHSEYLKQHAEIQYDFPAECARKLIKKEVDIGLVPVAVIPMIENSEIVTPYCIGADGEVYTVVLLSDVPIHEIETILLDYQSRTSVRLMQVLAQHHWNIEPEWKETTAGFENKIGGKTAAVVIGDRVFSARLQHKYCYDLAAEWKNYCGLPFAFANWVSSRKLPLNFVEGLSQALLWGIEHTEQAVCEYIEQNDFPKDVLMKYLTQYIDYDFNPKKQEALRRFLSLI